MWQILRVLSSAYNLTYRSRQESDRRVYTILRSGSRPSGFANTAGMSVAHLGLALTVLKHEHKRLDRIGKRPDRRDGRKKVKGTAEDS